MQTIACGSRRSIASRWIAPLGDYTRFGVYNGKFSEVAILLGLGCDVSNGVFAKTEMSQGAYRDLHTAVVRTWTDAQSSTCTL